MKIGHLSDFTQKELTYPTFAIVATAVPDRTCFIIPSLTMPSECAGIVDSVTNHVNGSFIRSVIVRALKRCYPDVDDAVFEYVPKQDRVH